MSGLEVAGVILGVVPIVVEAIKQCYNTYKILQRALRYRVLMEQIIARLYTNRMKLQSHMSGLTRLSGVDLKWDQPERCLKQLKDQKTLRKLEDVMSNTEQCRVLNILLDEYSTTLLRIIKKLPLVKPPRASAKVPLRSFYERNTRFSEGRFDLFAATLFMVHIPSVKERVDEQDDTLGRIKTLLGQFDGDSAPADVSSSGREWKRALARLKRVQNAADNLNQALTPALSTDCHTTHQTLLRTEQDYGKARIPGAGPGTMFEIYVSPGQTMKLTSGLFMARVEAASENETAPNPEIMTEDISTKRKNTPKTVRIQFGDREISISRSRKGKPPPERTPSPGEASARTMGSAETLPTVGGTRESIPLSTLEPPSMTSANKQDIINVCEAVQEADRNGQVLAIVPCGKQFRRLDRHIDPCELHRTNSVISLADLVAGSINARQRTHLGLSLFEVIIDFHGTALTMDTWNNSLVYFGRDEQGQADLTRPLVLKSYPPPVKQSRPSPTETLTQIIILLLEICQRTTMQAWSQDPAIACRIADCNDTESIARIWCQETLNSLEDLEFAAGIRACLDAMAEERDRGWDSGSLRQRLYEGALVPFKERCKQWDRLSG